MKIFPIAVALIAAVMLGVVESADARDRGARQGAEKQGRASMQHKADPRSFQRSMDRRQVRQRTRIRQGARSGRSSPGEVAHLRGKQKHIRSMERHFGADGRYNRQERRILNHALHGSSKRIWRMKGKRYRRHGAYQPKYPVRSGFRKHGHHRGHQARQVEYVYPAYDEFPAESLGLDIETNDFRFSVNKSG